MTKYLTVLALTSILITTIFAQSQMASATDSANVVISPINPPVAYTGSQVTLTVTVTDVTNPAYLPTGTVSFGEVGPGAPVGSFTVDKCVLTPGTKDSQCQVTWTAPATLPTPPIAQIQATYNGDSTIASGALSNTMPINIAIPPPSNSAQASVTILGTCGIAVLPTSITFGQTLPGDTPILATNNPIVITNNGNTAASPVTVTGTDWLSGTTVGILAQETAFSAVGSNGPFQPLNPTAIGKPNQVTGSLTSGSPLDTYWQLTPSTVTNQIVGQLTQTLTFSGGC